MRYLILGGAGFIGTNLVQYLLDASTENHVIVVDDESTGNLKRLDDLFHPRLTMLRMDISQPDVWRDLEHWYRDYPIDVIYNLACPASPVHYMRDPIQTIVTSTHGVLRGLQYALDHKCMFFQASTSEIYGDPEVHPQPETYYGNVNTWGPRACYDEGKRLAETLCYEYQRKGVNLRIARIFNTYGPHMAKNDGRVVSNFIVQALAGNDITIHGDGSQTRSFCYIDDMIQGFMALGVSGIQFPVNLGNPGEFTVKQLAELVITLTESSSRIVYVPLGQDDPKQRKPVIGMAQLFGWQPEIQLLDGLTKTIDYFRSV